MTHAHLVEVLNAEMVEVAPEQGDIRILDVGCGNGNLMSAIHRFAADPVGRTIRVFGFDVTDARVQRSDFFARTLATLRNDAPEVDWSTRTDVVASRDAWPQEDRSCDFVVTNQVLEHVSDIDFFMAELQRVLKPGGVSLNLFPMKALVIEGHTGIPFGHRLHSDDVRRSYMTRMAALGLARLGPMRMTPGQTASHFGRTRSEYVATQTHYRSFAELARAAHRRGLTASYRWTPHFYLLKLSYLAGVELTTLYRRPRLSRFLEASTFSVLSRVSSVTVRLQKDAAYDPDDEFAGHLG